MPMSDGLSAQSTATASIPLTTVGPRSGAGRVAAVPAGMGMGREYPPYTALDDQVVLEVQVRRIEGELSASARRELVQANVTLLEDIAALLRHRLDRPV
jgi:hypothetical protein